MSQFIEMFGNPLSQEQKYPMRKLSDCCIINPRRTSINLTDSDYVSFVPMPSVSENGSLQDVMDKEYGKVKKGFTYFENNDVLFAKITPCMENGKGAIAHGLTNGIGMGSTEFHILRPIKGLSNPYWLLCLTRMPIFRKLAEKNMSGTGGQKRVGAAFLENFMIGLPPIEAQNTFEEVYKQADKSKFVGFKSQFIEMFKNESLQVPLEKIVEVKDDCRKPINEGERSEMKEGDLYPYYGATGIVDYINDYITDEELLCIAEDCGNYKAGEESAYIIRGKAWVNNHAHLVKVKDSCDIKYLYYYLKITNLMPYVSGTTRLKLTQKKLKEILVTLPSAELQNRFVAIAQQADKSKLVD